MVQVFSAIKSVQRFLLHDLVFTFQHVDFVIVRQSINDDSKSSMLVDRPAESITTKLVFFIFFKSVIMATEKININDDFILYVIEYPLHRQIHQTARSSSRSFSCLCLLEGCANCS